MRNLLIISVFFLFACQQKPSIDSNIPYELYTFELASPTQSSLRGISVVDSNTAWLSGANGTVIKISSGGHKVMITKSPDRDTLDFRDIQAFSEKDILVSSAGFPSRIYRSSNSGMQWELIYENSDSSAFINSIHFKNPKEGLVLGDRLGKYHFVMRSLDSGESWTRIDSQYLPKPLRVEHGFAASGSCITVNSNNEFVIGLGGEQSRVLIEDSKLKWEAVNTDLADSLPTSGIYSIASSETLLMAVGGDYSKVDKTFPAVISDNGGKSWEKVGKLGGYRSVVDYCEKYNIWLAAGTNGIDISWNDGKDWSRFSNLKINTLQFADGSDIAYAANSDGKIYKLIIEPKK